MNLDELLPKSNTEYTKGKIYVVLTVRYEFET